MFGYIKTKASNWQYICVRTSASILASCFAFFAFSIYPSLLSFFLVLKLVVVVCAVFSLCLSCLHGSSERYSKSFHSHFCCAIPFRSVPIQSTLNVCILVFRIVGFYVHSWYKVIFLYAMLYDLIWRMFSSYSCFWFCDCITLGNCYCCCILYSLVIILHLSHSFALYRSVHNVCALVFVLGIKLKPHWNLKQLENYCKTAKWAYMKHVALLICLWNGIC